MASILSKCARYSMASCRPSALRPFPTLSLSYGLGVPVQQRSFSATAHALARRYTESHEWIDVGPDGKTCTIGISNYAAAALGDVVYVELPSVGDETSQGEAFGTVESVKSASDVVAPVSGIVVEVNEGLDDTPGDLSKDPEGSAWLVKITAPDVSVVDSMMSKEVYAEHTKDK